MSPEYYDRKTKEYFALHPDHTPVDQEIHRLFNTFAQSQSIPYVVECGFKITQQEVVSARRVQYWFNKEPAAVMYQFEQLLPRFESLGFTLNRSLLQVITGRMNPTQISRFVIGYDLRPAIENSRIEAWYQIENQPVLIDEVLAHHGTNARVLQLLNKNKLAVGVDMNYIGSTRFKIYPEFYAPEWLQKPEAAHMFHPATVAFLKQVNLCHLAYSEQLERIIHADPLHPDTFIQRTIVVPILSKLYNQVTFKEPGAMFVAVAEQQVIDGRIQWANFYY